jgi:biopolymer transport protein ExbD
MKLKRRKKTGFTDSSTSSDISFLLIIYFIVIAGFTINKGFLINLPNKDSTRLILKDDLLRFEMDGSGNINYEEQVMGIIEAEKLIARVQAENPNVAVLLSIDPQAQWQRVVYFVELAKDLKIDSFSFAMKKEGP